MAQLNDADFQVIQQLRADGILEDEDARKVSLDNGAIVIPCSDGDQMPDLFSHDKTLAEQSGGKVRPHMPSLHGGAMLIADTNPLYRDFKVDELLLTHITQAVGMKDIHTVVLYVHAPCGAAGMAGLNVVQQLMHLARAKERVLELGLDIKVVNKVHVDYGTLRENPARRRRTYFISRNKWIAYWQEKGRKQWGSFFEEDPYPNV